MTAACPRTAILCKLCSKPDSSVYLIDIPHTLELAQESFPLSLSHLISRILSSEPLEKPNSGTQPKSQKAKDNAVYASGEDELSREAEEHFRSYLGDALERLKVAWTKQDWCHDRLRFEDCTDTRFRNVDNKTFSLDAKKLPRDDAACDEKSTRAASTIPCDQVVDSGETPEKETETTRKPGNDNPDHSQKKRKNTKRGYKYALHTIGPPDKQNTAPSLGSPALDFSEKRRSSLTRTLASTKRGIREQYQYFRMSNDEAIFCRNASDQSVELIFNIPVNLRETFDLEETVQPENEETVWSANYRIPPKSTLLCGNIAHTRRTFIAKAPQFELIILDPPWPNRSATRKNSYSTCYDSRSIRDLLSSLPLKGKLATGGTIAIWVTNKRAFRDMIVGEGGLFDEWGVQFYEELTWLKVTRHGEPVYSLSPQTMDAWSRKPWECLLVGRRNIDSSPNTKAELKKRTIVAVPDFHSRKPNLRELFPKEAEGEVLEIFARNLTAGWWAWGNEVLKFQAEECWEDECTESSLREDRSGACSVSRKLNLSCGE